MSGKVYGYCRVSTKGQALANGLEVQEQDILARYSNAIIVTETYTGATKDRPALNNTLNSMTRGDMLVVTKLDRLARSTAEGIELIKGLFDKGVAVHVLNIGLLEDTNMGNFFITVLLAVAEMEKNTIIERTNAGRAIARQRPDYREGRPPQYTKAQLDHAVKLLETNSYTQVAKMTRISKATITREVRKRKLANMTNDK